MKYWQEMERSLKSPFVWNISIWGINPWRGRARFKKLQHTTPLLLLALSETPSSPPPFSTSFYFPICKRNLSSIQILTLLLCPCWEVRVLYSIPHLGHQQAVSKDVDFSCSSKVQSNTSLWEEDYIPFTVPRHPAERKVYKVFKRNPQSLFQFVLWVSGCGRDEGP